MQNQLFTLQTIDENLILVIPVLGRAEYQHAEFVFSTMKDANIFMATWRYHCPLTAIRHHESREAMVILNECYG